MSAASEIYEAIRTEADISNLFETFATENIHIDFKEVRGNVTANINNLRNVFAKAVSGFSNSDGGVLIFGVVDNNADPRFTLSPFKNYLALQENLQKSISRVTEPPNNMVLTKTIQKDADSGYVIVLIPKGETGPYQEIGEKKYYLRCGESHLPMAHFQIADLFGRRPQPDLRATLTFHRDVNEPGHFSSTLRVTNVGLGLAKFPFIEVTDFGSFQKRQHFTSWFREGSEYRKKNFWIAGQNQVIHSDVDVPVHELFISYGHIENPRNVKLEISGRIGCDSHATREFKLLVELESVIRFRDETTFDIPPIHG